VVVEEEDGETLTQVDTEGVAEEEAAAEVAVGLTTSAVAEAVVPEEEEAVAEVSVAKADAMTVTSLVRRRVSRFRPRKLVESLDAEGQLLRTSNTSLGPG